MTSAPEPPTLPARFGIRAVWLITSSAFATFALCALLALTCMGLLAAGMPDYRWPGPRPALDIFGNISSLALIGIMGAIPAVAVALVGWAFTSRRWFRARAAAAGLGARGHYEGCVAVGLVVAGALAAWVLAV